MTKNLTDSFRGRNPPASLKPELFADIDEGTVDMGFPGEKSPGLIEAPCGTIGSEHIRRFPGEKSPGLIEALLGTWCS